VSDAIGRCEFTEEPDQGGAAAVAEAGRCGSDNRSGCAVLAAADADFDAGVGAVAGIEVGELATEIVGGVAVSSNREPA
jgi:hypothetical protein